MIQLCLTMSCIPNKSDQIWSRCNFMGASRSDFTTNLSFAMLSTGFIDFMMLYVHISTAFTHLLSALSFYILLSRTPKYGKAFAKYLILLQVMNLIHKQQFLQKIFFQCLVTLVDLNFGLLLCPIFMFPAPAALCEGIICHLGFSSHIGQVR